MQAQQAQLAPEWCRRAAATCSHGRRTCHAMPDGMKPSIANCRPMHHAMCEPSVQHVVVVHGLLNSMQVHAASSCGLQTHPFSDMLPLQCAPVLAGTELVTFLLATTTACGTACAATARDSRTTGKFLLSSMPKCQIGHFTSTTSGSARSYPKNPGHFPPSHLKYVQVQTIA